MNNLSHLGAHLDTSNWGQSPPQLLSYQLWGQGLCKGQQILQKNPLMGLFINREGVTGKRGGRQLSTAWVSRVHLGGMSQLS